MSAIRISEFDLWRPGYGGATVSVYLAGTTTLASVYTNESLSAAADNPQTLSSQTISGITYGKFAAPLYVGAAYYLDIDSTDQTGISRPPLTTLDGEDASDAVVTPTGGSVASTIADLFARKIWAPTYGEIGTSASTNNTTLTAAIAIAAGYGGGQVVIPFDTAIPFTTLTLSAGVVLRGQGRSGSPTVLQSTSSGNLITIGGDGAGLKDIVLDGISTVAGSVGLYAENKNEIVLDNVLIKRFETGEYLKGGARHNWREFYIDACVNGLKGHGDTNTLKDITWNGGTVSACTTLGVELSYEDQVVQNVRLNGVGFSANTGTALAVNGARFIEGQGCWWTGNTTDFVIQDDSDASVTDNTVIGFKLRGGSMSGGAATFSGTCQDIEFEGVALSNVDFTMTTPGNNIVWTDCTEDSQVTLAGTGTRIVRRRKMLADAPNSVVVTTTATATKSWELTLNPGERAMIDATVIGNWRNLNAYYVKRIKQFAHRPASTLAYEGQTANFTLGTVLSGATSGATARIVADSDSGATGTLSIREIVGTFADGEAITDTSGGAAIANGTQSNNNVALLGSATVDMAEVTSGSGGVPSCAIAANGPAVEIQVTGVASETVEWTTAVSVAIG